ncbi:MAG: hypothetical protein ABSC64_00780 [Candidatus Korobacteraceae bacterium]|jgi:hypothetical protein
MQSQFDLKGRSCDAASFGSQETPSIKSQNGQQNVTTASGPVSGVAVTVNAKPLTMLLQWGHFGFISDIDENSFHGFLSFKAAQ